MYLTLLFAIFADFPFVAQSEVPDWSSTVVIGLENFNSFSHKFEVSPEHDFGNSTIHIAYFNKQFRTNLSEIKYIQTDLYHSAILIYLPLPFLSLYLYCDLPDVDYSDDIIQVSMAFGSYSYQHAFFIDRNSHVCLILPVWLV